MVAHAKAPPSQPLHEASFHRRRSSHPLLGIGLALAAVLPSCERRHPSEAPPSFTPLTVLGTPSTGRPAPLPILAPLSEVKERYSSTVQLMQHLAQLREALLLRSIPPPPDSAGPHPSSELVRSRLELLVSVANQSRVQELEPLMEEVRDLLTPAVSELDQHLTSLVEGERSLETVLHEAIDGLEYARDSCEQYAGEIAKTLRLWEALRPVHEHAERLLSRFSDLGISDKSTPIEALNMLAAVAGGELALCEIREESQQLVEALESASMVLLEERVVPVEIRPLDLQPIVKKIHGLLSTPAWTGLTTALEAPLPLPERQGEILTLQLAGFQQLRECAISAELAVQGVSRCVGLVRLEDGRIAVSLNRYTRPETLYERMMTSIELKMSFEALTELYKQLNDPKILARRSDLLSVLLERVQRYPNAMGHDVAERSLAWCLARLPKNEAEKVSQTLPPHLRSTLEAHFSEFARTRALLELEESKLLRPGAMDHAIRQIPLPERGKVPTGLPHGTMPKLPRGR